MNYLFLFFGAFFGFLLSRAGATTSDFYAGLFLFKDLQLLWVMVSAVSVGIVGIYLLKKFNVKAVISRDRLTFVGKPLQKGLATGALLFGAGWGLTGSCPGSAPAMVGEGKIMPVFTVIGIIIGTYLYGLYHSKHKKNIAAQEIRTPARYNR